MPKKEKRYVINRGLNRVAYASIEKVDTTKDNLLLVHENADGEDSNSKSVMTMSLTWWQNFPWTMANRNADKQKCNDNVTHLVAEFSMDHGQ
ncbi:hypothetical protein QE152_g7172 [Popillia japonica]|uniref:Uncharacterized protein n=1 Tax=Popillia japonica TaxID=7064 RepID=A0AAW1MG82_POPJA